MSKVAIVATPYILYEYHYIFMVQTVLSLLNNRHEHELDLIAVVNAFRREESGMDWVNSVFDVVHTNDRNNLARAWNWGIEKAFERGADYVVVINLDLIFHTLYIKNIVEFAQKYPEPVMWSSKRWEDQKTLQSAALEANIVEDIDTSCFMIDKRLFEIVGKFDEQFEPAYHEDKDMLYRMSLCGQTFLSTTSARFHHVDRTTITGAIINNDTKFLDKLKKCMTTNRERYRAKWGGFPGEETFKIPYDGKEKSGSL